MSLTTDQESTYVFCKTTSSVSADCFSFVLVKLDVISFSFKFSIIFYPYFFVYTNEFLLRLYKNKELDFGDDGAVYVTVLPFLFEFVCKNDTALTQQCSRISLGFLLLTQKRLKRWLSRQARHAVGSRKWCYDLSFTWQQITRCQHSQLWNLFQKIRPKHREKLSFWWKMSRKLPLYVKKYLRYLELLWKLNKFSRSNVEIPL